MKVLIAYYSRTGHARKVAKLLAKELNADLEQIIDKTNRAGIIGWFLAGRDAMKKRPTTIEPPKKDPAAYDLIILGSPLWAFANTAPALRTYVEQQSSKFKKVAFFLTKGGSDGKIALADLTQRCGKNPLAILEVNDRELSSDKLIEKIKVFVATISAGAAA